MNENVRHTSLSEDELMRRIAKNGGHRNPLEERKLATPQQIGETVSKYAKESDDANADDPSLLEKIRRPETALLLLMIASIGISAMQSGAGQEILRKLSGQ
ncbi:hypothetical protein H3C66_03655 [Patescibacteria group bacterium]|nr:hypothetical protein [Patescibacteria group bacterium]